MKVLNIKFRGSPLEAELTPCGKADEKNMAWLKSAFRDCANAPTDDVKDTAGGQMFTCQASAATLRVYSHNEKLKTETSGWLVKYEFLNAMTMKNVTYN